MKGDSKGQDSPGPLSKPPESPAELSPTSLATQGCRPNCRVGRVVTIVLGEGGRCRGVHNRLLPALLGGAGGLGDQLILLLFFFLPPEWRGHRSGICLSHGLQWPSGGRMQSWGRLSDKSWRQRSLRESAPQDPGSEPPEAPRSSKAPGSHAPSSGFWAIIATTITPQRTLVCGPDA